MGFSAVKGRTFEAWREHFFEKFMLVCGENHVGLWEKFGEQSIVLDNSRQFLGKIQ